MVANNDFVRFGIKVTSSSSAVFLTFKKCVFQDLGSILYKLTSLSFWLCVFAILIMGIKEIVENSCIKNRKHCPDMA